MSGHNKWSQIKFQKGIKDVRRGREFSKLSNAIAAAVRMGGPDSNTNLRLRLLLEQARNINLPKENVLRAIKRGTGQVEGLRIEQHLYEAYGPGGIAVLLEATSDNKNRTTSEIRSVLNRFGGKLAQQRSVAYLFEQQGLLTINLDQSGLNKDVISLKAIDAGALDIEEQNNNLFIYTDYKELELIKKRLEGEKIPVAEANLSFEPKTMISISDKATASQILKLMAALEELEDITAIYSNFDIPAD